MGGFFGQAQAVAQPYFQNDSHSQGDIAGPIVITASATTHTKGAWTELIASTTTDSDCLTFLVDGIAANTQNTATLLDIGTGSSGNETAIASNIAVGSATAAGATGIDGGRGTRFCLPVKTSSGTRISARSQANLTSDTANLYISCYNFGQSSLVPTTVDILGTTTNNSRGTVLSASNAWTQIVASTTKEYIGLGFVISAATTNNPSSLSNIKAEIGVGASGSEVVVGSQRFYFTGLEQMTNDTRGNIYFFSGGNFQAGTRISARQDSASTLIDVCIIAVPKP